MVVCRYTSVMTFDLKPFNIGPFRMDFPVVLSALAGYSDLPYRLICRRLGAPYCVTEMLLDRLLVTKGKHRARSLRLTGEDHPVAGQLLGSDRAVMTEAAGELSRSGFDVIDLNFACPVRKALARKRGGYLMSRPDQAIQIVRAVTEAVEKPVTLKLRRAFLEADKANDAFWRIAEGAFDAGAAAVCVHARSVQARYAGPADWEFLAAVKRHFADRTIIGSGDVLRPADVLRMLDETSVDAVAVARGALGNPWFFRQTADLAAGREPYRPALAEQRELLAGHFRDACDLYGPDRGPKIMRKFGIKYARLHPRPKDLRVAFCGVKRPDDWQAVLDKFYGDDYECV